MRFEHRNVFLHGWLNVMENGVRPKRIVGRVTLCDCLEIVRSLFSLWRHRIEGAQSDSLTKVTLGAPSPRCRRPGIQTRVRGQLEFRDLPAIDIALEVARAYVGGGAILISKRELVTVFAVISFFTCTSSSLATEPSVRGCTKSDVR
jgi:hypothetical protein